MHVATVRSTHGGRTYASTYLRQSYRDEQGRVQKKTLANLTPLPDEAVELIRGVLKGRKYAELKDLFEPPARSRPHGATQAVLDAMDRIGLPGMIAARRCRERDLACAMIAARIMRPRTKLATWRWWRTVTLGERLGVEDAGPDELYAAMDWLGERQDAIQRRLARRWIAEGSLVLYDLTSTYFEGVCCPLAERGYSRDRRGDRLQVNFGLLCDDRGRPVAVSVHSGSTADPETFMPEVRRLRRKFGFRRVVVAGDRGMLVNATIETLRRFEGVDWISALRSASIRKLVRDRMLDPLDERNLFELSHPDFPGERLIACRNPRLAGRRRRIREELLAATETLLAAIARRVRAGTLSGEGKIGETVGRDANKYKVRKHFRLEIGEDSFRYERDQAKIDAEAALDGIYVVRTSLEAGAMDSEDCVRSYKALTRVERAFRCLKLQGLRVRPIHHRLAHRVRSHIFICMLACLVEWHMRRAWAPLTFADEELDESRRTRDPVLPAERSAAADRKARTGKLPDGGTAYKFEDLLEDLDAIVTNSHRTRTPAGGRGAVVEVNTLPSPLQQRAFDLLEEISAM